MSLEERVAELVEPSLNGLGYDLVRVRFVHGTLQVMAERRDEAPMTVDDCTTISHSVSALLDVADAVKSSYTLEVSSPGLDRPLVRLADFERFSGLAAKIEMKLPVDGRRKFAGVLGGANGPLVRLETEEGLVELSFADIAQARLDVSAGMLKPEKAAKRKKA